MRIALILFFLFLTSARIHAAMQPNDLEPGFSVFQDLSKENATQKAQSMAKADFARNSFRIFVAGMRRQQDKHDKFLNEKYGVIVISVAGCVVTDGIIGGIEGYNSTMKPLLN